MSYRVGSLVRASQTMSDLNMGLRRGAWSTSNVGREDGYLKLGIVIEIRKSDVYSEDDCHPRRYSEDDVCVLNPATGKTGWTWASELREI